MRLRESASGVAAGGACTINFPQVPRQSAWTGTVSVPNSPPGATWNVLVEDRLLGVATGQSSFGPLQVLNSEQLKLQATSGLTDGITYQAVLVGINSVAGTEPAVSPAPLASSVSLSGGTIDINDISGPVTVEQGNASNLQVATDIANVTPSPAPSGTFNGSVTGIPPWATHLVVTATVPAGDIMTPMSVSAQGGVSLTNLTPTTLYLTGNQTIVSIPVIGGIDSSVDFNIAEVVSGESGTSPTYGFFAYAHVPRIPRPPIEVASSTGDADAFLLTAGTSTQVFELLDIDLNINASANSGANVQMVPPGGTIGGYHKILRCGLAATSTSTSSVHAHLNFLDSENNGYVLQPGIQLGVSVSSCYYNASVVYRTLVN